MKSGRIPSQTRTTTCSALPFGAAPTSATASRPTRTTTQRQTYFITIDSQPATGGRIDKVGKVCRALSSGQGTATEKVADDVRRRIERRTIAWRSSASSRRRLQSPGLCQRLWTAPLRVWRVPATNAQTDAQATCRSCTAAQLPGGLPPEFDRFADRPAHFGAARSSPEEGNRAQPDDLLEPHGTRGDGA